MCQYTPDNKRTKNTNQTKMCAIMVFYVYFVLYIELLFGNVGLNGSIDTKVNALNPSSARRSYVYGEIGKEGDGWYRFARITFIAEPSAKGGGSELIEVMINQSYTNSPGCFHKVDFYLKYVDSAIISTIGNNSTVLKKIRMVRNNKTIFIDVYSVGIVNKTKMLLYIPSDFGIDSVECITPYLVPENSDGELIVCSSDLANSI